MLFTITILKSLSESFLCYFSFFNYFQGKNPRDLFEGFDDEPLGTASLAQVHRATLVGGDEVAVKVNNLGGTIVLYSDSIGVQILKVLLIELFLIGKWK